MSYAPASPLHKHSLFRLGKWAEVSRGGGVLSGLQGAITLLVYPSSLWDRSAVIASRVSSPHVSGVAVMCRRCGWTCCFWCCLLVQRVLYGRIAKSMFSVSNVSLLIELRVS